MVKITVVGGAGAMGRLFSRFLSQKGYEVTLCDIDPRTPAVATEMGLAYEADTVKAAMESDGVLFSVPIETTVETIKKIAPRMRSGSFLMDLTSVKKGPVEAMKNFAAEDVEIIGAHPMFGPTVPDFKGQIVIFTPVGRGTWFQRITKHLEDAGARIEILTPEEHDRRMAVVQGLVHFAHLALAQTLRELKFDVQGARATMSPFYETALDLVGRLLAQNPRLYGSLQMHLDVARAHQTYLQEAQRLARLIQNKDLATFEKEFLAARAHYPDPEEALKRTDELFQKMRKTA